jgi:hypothetical protein
VPGPEIATRLVIRDPSVATVYRLLAEEIEHR